MFDNGCKTPNNTIGLIEQFERLQMEKSKMCSILGENSPPVTFFSESILERMKNGDGNFQKELLEAIQLMQHELSEVEKKIHGMPYSWDVMSELKLIREEVSETKQYQKEHNRSIDEIMEEFRERRKQKVDVEKRNKQISSESIKIRLVTPLKLETLDMKSLDTIYTMKMKIHEKRGIPTDEQRLVFNGRPMKNKKTLRDVGITNGSKVHLVLRYRG